MGKALDKFAFSITDDGHKMDAETYRIAGKAYKDMGKSVGEYEDNNPLKAAYLGLSKRNQEVVGNKMDYLAAKHEGKENSYNPFAGLSSESAKKQRAKNKIKG